MQIRLYAKVIESHQVLTMQVSPTCMHAHLISLGCGEIRMHGRGSDNNIVVSVLRVKSRRCSQAQLGLHSCHGRGSIDSLAFVGRDTT